MHGDRCPGGWGWSWTGCQKDKLRESEKLEWITVQFFLYYYNLSQEDFKISCLGDRIIK